MSLLKNVFILTVVFGLFFANAARASGDIPLRLKAGMITEAEFPEKIANVTKSIPSDILQIETLEDRMFLLPRENFDSRVFVVTQDNVSYCLHLIMDEAQSPTRIKIQKPKESIREVKEKDTENTVELLKSLLTGYQPAGSTSSRMHPQEVFNDGKLRIAVDTVYEFPGNMKAFCLTFENLTHKPVAVPIEHIELPGLLAISIESQILEARPHDFKKKNSAYIAKAYMVVEGLNQ